MILLIPTIEDDRGNTLRFGALSDELADGGGLFELRPLEILVRCGHDRFARRIIDHLNRDMLQAAHHREAEARVAYDKLAAQAEAARVELSAAIAEVDELMQEFQASRGGRS
jgi:hypothetical protein